MKSFFRLVLALVFLVAIGVVSKAQTTIAFQGGEGTAADNWGYVAITNAGGPMPPGNVTTFPRTGSYAIRAGGGNNVGCSSGANCLSGGGALGCPSHGKTIQFNPVNVACLSNVQLSVYHRSHTFCSGNGYDSGESLFFEVRINGGSWTLVGTIAGFADYVWAYTTTPAGSGTTVPNPFVYNLPLGTNTFEFRTRTNTNRSDELYYIDDVKLTTTSTGYNFPGTAGLWNGIVDSNWNNICNWDKRTLPTNVDDVLIPNAALNICEVLPFTVAYCRDLVVDKAKLSVENPTSTLNVNGNLYINSNGELDLSLNNTQGGTVNLTGIWLNNRDETKVSEDGSTVNFIGSGLQTITIVNDTKEAFYKLGINKPSGSILLNSDLWIDKNNFGGPVTLLNIQSGTLNLNAGELVIWNPNAIVVQRLNGGIMSERIDNSSKITWKTGSNLGNYVFPFINASGNYIPLFVDFVSGASVEITASTYGTPPNNLPWPSAPVSVQNLISSAGLSPDNRDATVDRFWQLDVAGSAVADLTFNYTASELPISPFNNPAGIKAQRYNSGTNVWQPYLPGQTSSPYTVNVPSVTDFSTWTLTSYISPLPIELLSFDAKLNEHSHTELSWTTASELNNDYFTLEKSKDGVAFESFYSVNGAGNSNNPIRYEALDKNPVEGITYYRLKQTDFDGQFSYSEIKAVRLENDASDEFIVYPSLVSDYFYVQFNLQSANSSLYIFDVTGKMVREITADVLKDGIIKVDRLSLDAGIYFISTAEGKVQKLVLQ